jgi:tetratricopeptide (TPR) repeat protein
MLTGVTPPEAGDVYDEGLPPMKVAVSDCVRRAVEKAMIPSRKARLQSVKEFLDMLNNSEVQDDGKTEIIFDNEYKSGDKEGVTPNNYTQPEKPSDCGLAPPSIEMAIGYYNSGMYSKAIDELKFVIQVSNNPIALYYLGLCYYNGQGVTRQYSTAVKYFSEAAEKGLTDAQYQLGRCYKFGAGVKRDTSKSKMWLKKAAQNGHIEAQKELNKSNNGCLKAVLIIFLILMLLGIIANIY